MIPYENLGKVNAPWSEELHEVIKDVLDSGWFILGKEVEAFEAEFADFTGMPYCIGVASGLDALVLSLLAADLPPGSEIIVPANAYYASILAIRRAGHIPVLVEPDPNTCNLDPSLIEQSITDKTAGIMPVHLYGKISDMQAIMRIAEKHSLVVVEDCAQAHSAAQFGKQAGTFGDFGAFSFFPTKNLGAIGDAGAVVVKDANLAERLRKLRNYGASKKYYFEYEGYNSRLDELQAAVLRVKLKHLDSLTRHKQSLAALYFQGLNLDALILPDRNKDFTDVHHIFNVRYPKRDQLKKYLSDNEIGTEIHYPLPPYQQKAFKGLFNGSYPISDKIHATTLSLPISYCHKPEQIMKVIDVINQYSGE